MKTTLLLASALLLGGPVRAADWKLVWADEFNLAGAPDPSRWTYEEGFVRNNESQYYTRARSENARVEGGVLVIEARKERFANPSFQPGASGRRRSEFAEYTSASVTTEGTAAWRYGRIEVRAKLPAGRGMWPAIWMLGANHRQAGWPRCGEIDIMENVGFEPGLIYANIHTQSYNHVQKTGEAAWPFSQPFYLILNIAVGGAWGGQKGIDDSIFPRRFEIDYVRVYERPGQ